MNKVPPPVGRPMAPPGRKIPAPIPKAKIPPSKMIIQDAPEEERPQKINNSLQNQLTNKTQEAVPSNFAQTAQNNQIEIQIAKVVEKEQISNNIENQSQKTEVVQVNTETNQNDLKISVQPNFVQNKPNKTPPPPPTKKPPIIKPIPKAPVSKAKIPQPIRNLNQTKIIQQIGQAAIEDIPNPISAPQNIQKEQNKVSRIESEQKHQKIESIEQNVQPVKPIISQKPQSKAQKLQQTQNSKPQHTIKKPQPQKAISQINQNSSLTQKTPLKVQSSITISQKSPQKSALSKKLQQLKKATEQMLKQDQYNDDQQQDNQVSITPSELNYVQDVVIEESSSEKITKQEQKPLSHSSVPVIIQQQEKKNPPISISNKVEEIQNEDKVPARSAPFRPAPAPPSKGTKNKMIAPPQPLKIVKPPVVTIAQKKEDLEQKIEPIKQDDNFGKTNPFASEQSKNENEQNQLKGQKSNSHLPASSIQLPKIQSKVKVTFEQPIKKNQEINHLLQRYHNLKNGYLNNLKQLDDLIHFQKQQQQHQIQKINSLLSQLRKKNQILRKACSSKSISAPSQELQAISI